MRAIVERQASYLSRMKLKKRSHVLPEFLLLKYSQSRCVRESNFSTRKFTLSGVCRCSKPFTESRAASNTGKWFRKLTIYSGVLHSSNFNFFSCLLTAFTTSSSWAYSSSKAFHASVILLHREIILLVWGSTLNFSCSNWLSSSH